jgi:probable O-glycosylation ligase (exosortase A-associated)
MIIFLLWKSRQRMQMLLVAIIAIPVALAVMPAKWFDRMDTIANYEKDTTGSAGMRFNSWGTMFNIAKDRPLIGGGFEVSTKEVYDRYAPDPTFPPQTAHSIYFQAMGEHGFVGFALYLSLYFLFWRHAGALARVTRGRPDLLWAHNFGLMMQVSLVGFLAGGAFLSLVLYDVPYYLIGTLIAVRVLVDKELRAAGPAPALPRPANPFSSLPSDRLPRPGGS